MAKLPDLTPEELNVLEAAAAGYQHLYEDKGRLYIHNGQTNVSFDVPAAVVAKLQKVNAVRKLRGNWAHEFQYDVISIGRAILKENKRGMWREQ